MALERGSRLGPYEIVAALGAGGMGEVYRARDTRLERPVAVKILPPHLTTSAPARERFQREARAVAALQHPNICTIFDIGETKDHQHFIVMDRSEFRVRVRVRVRISKCNARLRPVSAGIARTGTPLVSRWVYKGIAKRGRRI